MTAAWEWDRETTYWFAQLPCYKTSNGLVSLHPARCKILLHLSQKGALPISFNPEHLSNLRSAGTRKLYIQELVKNPLPPPIKKKKKKKVQHSFMRLLVGSVEPPHSQALGSPHQHVQAKGQILHKGDLPKETFQIHSSCQDPVSGSPAFLTRFISLSSSLLP